MNAARALFGLILGLIARAWLATLRVTVVRDAALDGDPAARAAWVLSFWHGTQWPLLAWRRRRATVALVSWSADGAIQARALRTLGMVVVRGSSSRGGARGLAGVVHAMRRGADAAFAVDGPRGPYGVAKPGAVVAARAAAALLVPMGSAVARGIVLGSAWDRFALAWPFSRVAVVLGAPIAPDAPDAREALERGIEAANARAAEALGTCVQDARGASRGGARDGDRPEAPCASP